MKQAYQGYSDKLLGQKGLVAWQRLARFRKTAAAIQKVSGQSQVDRLVDLGAADGISLPFMAPICQAYFAVNRYWVHSQEFQNNHPDRPIVAADGRHLPYASDSIDAVISLETIHLMANMGFRCECLDQIRRILKPNGVFVCSVPVEVGVPAFFKYVGRKAGKITLEGMSFGVMLKHCLHPWIDVSHLDVGHQVGFDAYRFADEIGRRFKIIGKISIPLCYPLRTNYMIIAQKR